VENKQNFSIKIERRTTMKLFKKIVTLCAILCLLGTSMAYAGTTYKSFSTTVGRVNGTGYTAYQKKAKTGADADLKTTSTGGYELDVRMIDENGCVGAWRKNIYQKDTYTVPGHQLQFAGYDARLQFSNDLTTLVNVQVEGTWRSN